MNDSLTQVIGRLLHFITQPDSVGITDEWLDTFRRDLRVAVMEIHDSWNNSSAPPSELSRMHIREAERLALDLAAILHSQPTLAVQPFTSWESAMYRTKANDLFELKDRLQQAGD